MAFDEAGDASARFRTLPRVPLQMSEDKPAPLRVVAQAVGQWVGRLGEVWVEAQVAQINRRAGTTWLTLRDPIVDMSLNASCRNAVLDQMPTELVPGAQVTVHGRFEYWEGRGSLTLKVDLVKPVGVGELLARIEQRRRLLAAEGLFAPERKRPLPFLPRCVGLVTAARSAAEKDVLEVARRRWPGVRFRVEHARVQGREAAAEVIEAVRVLDADDEVDVLVVARGGGSVEDLLPFSDEGLLRAVAACRTPVVSAIGHEQDSPLLDLVADLRAATPTDAAKQVVPDVAEQVAGVRQALQRVRHAVRRRVDDEQHRLGALRSRPALAAPHAAVVERSAAVAALRERAHRTLTHRLERATDEVAHHRARARALSPLQTLRRGYAVVQTADGRVASAVGAVAAGDTLSVRLADGRLDVRTEQVHPDPEEPDGQED